jgi:hypothetical protein
MNAAVLAPYGNPPLSNREAWGAYEALLADDRVTVRSDEPAGLTARWQALAIRDAASPQLWMDAYLAAFAMAAGCRLVTTDTGSGSVRDSTSCSCAGRPPQRTPVRPGQSWSAPSVHAWRPRSIAHSSSDPHSSRHDQIRVVNRCSSCSSV